MRSIAISVSVCLPVCLFVYLKNHVQFQEILCTLLVAVVGSFSDDSAIRYVLPVSWTTSYFHMMGPVVQNQARRYVSPSSPDGGTGGEVAVYDCKISIRRAVVHSFAICHLVRMTKVAASND